MRCSAVTAALAEGGPLVVDTGVHTGRSPQDKFVVREPGSEDRSGGARQPAVRGAAVRRGSRQGRRRTSSSATSTSSMRSPAPTRRTGSRVRVVTASPWHALSRRRSSSTRPRRSSQVIEPQALVLHAPEVEAMPDEDGTRTSTFVVLHPSRARGADRRHVLRGRDQEVDLHGDERPPAARGRPADALLRERRRRRAGRHLLRPLGHGEDDAVGRSGALADRRRRARLGRQRRLQHRGWLLREGDPPVGRGRAGDLPHDAHVRDGARERRRRRARHPRSRRRLEDREHARGVQARADRERAPREARRPSELGRVPDRGRVRDPAADRAADARPGALLVPLRASPRSSPGRRSASRSRSRRSRRVSARRSCRSRRASTRGCSGEKLDEHGATVWLVNTGWTGGAVRRGRADADRGHARAPARGALGRSRPRRVPDRRGLRLRGPGRSARCRRAPARSALDLARPVRSTTRKARELAAMFRDNFAAFAEDAGPEIAAAGPRS